MKTLTRVLVAAILVSRLAGSARAEPNYVYHERSMSKVNDLTGTCGGDRLYLNNTSPASFDDQILRFKIEYEAAWDQARVYYTIDGTTPTT